MILPRLFVFGRLENDGDDGTMHAGARKQIPLNLVLGGLGTLPSLSSNSIRQNEARVKGVCEKFVRKICAKTEMEYTHLLR